MNAMYCEKTTNPSHSKQEGISVECQQPRCQQSVLHSDQVGPCMVRSKFNKFEHIQGAGTGVLCTGRQGPVWERAGQGPVWERVGLGPCTGTLSCEQNDGHTWLKTLPSRNFVGGH